MKNTRLVSMIEIALMAAIALLIDLYIPSVSNSIKISFKMLPIMLLALRRGLLAGVAGGFLWGLLQIIVGEAYIVSVPQAFVEYILAFSAVGLTGLLYSRVQRQIQKKPYAVNVSTLWVSLSVIIGASARYFFHFIAGFLFWAEYAPEGTSPVLFSFLDNGQAFLTETVTCLVLVCFLSLYYREILVPRRTA